MTSLGAALARSPRSRRQQPPALGKMAHTADPSQGRPALAVGRRCEFHFVFDLRACSFSTIIRRSRARISLPALVDLWSPPDLGAGSVECSGIGLFHCDFGPVSGRNGSATSELLVTCREILPLVKPVLQTFQFRSQGILGQFGQCQTRGWSGEEHCRVSGLVQDILRKIESGSDFREFACRHCLHPFHC